MDRVQVLKRETGALGGDPADEAPWPEPIEPQEDAMEAAGVYVQDVSNRDETTLISRSGNDMLFKDGNNPSDVTLTQLLATGGGALPPATQIGQVLFSVNGTTFTVEQPLTEYGGGWLINDDGELIVTG